MWLPSRAMEHTNLGRTGLVVSRLCLGTMTFGFQCDERHVVRHPRRRLRAGHHLHRHRRRVPARRVVPHDRRAPRTSSGGGCEGKRDDVVLATKCHYPTSRRPWDQGNSRQHITSADRSQPATAAHRPRRPLPAARLGPEHADRRDASRPRRPRARGQGPLRRRARTSSPTSWPARSAAARCSAPLGSTACSPATTCCSARSSASCCRCAPRKGIGVIPYNPLAGGLLTGKHQRGGAPDGRHPLHARHRGGPLPGPLLARPGVRHRGARCGRSPPRPA